jgi:large subunit ribosomal protein L4
LVGGARVFGPKPRDYSFKLNKKVKLLARKSALVIQSAKIMLSLLLKILHIEAPKTKEFTSNYKES